MKPQKLVKVEKIPKVWKFHDDKLDCDGRYASFFSLQDGEYEILEQDGKFYLQKTYESGSSQSIVLYKEIIETLDKGQTVLVDEDVLRVIEK